MNRLRMVAAALALSLTANATALATAPSPAPAAVASAGAGKLTASLAAAIAAAQSTDQIPVVVHMVGRADLNLPAGPRAARLAELVRRLKALQALRHPLLMAQLQAWKNAGSVTAYESFWLSNCLAVTATSAVITTIAGRADVESIDLDTGQIAPASSLAATTEPSITATGAPSLWAQGVTGQGVVVANLDTGVDPTNPDLAANWRGGTSSWFDPYGQSSTPTDVSGHGTATMSLMVGAGAGGTNIGMAPGAKWIAAKIFNNSGTATLSAIHAAYQWILDPDGNPSTADAPQVVDNSWTSISPGCSTEFQVDLQVLRAAGILPVFAAGNGGPSASSSLSPANLPEAYAVGGVDASGNIDTGSSRGPSACANVPHYPSIVAPDVNVVVADLYGLYTANTGTSFAAPQVAGALALVLGVAPTLTADQQAAALTAGASDLGAPGPDDTFGAGLVSAPATLAAATAGGAPCSGATTSSVTVTPSVTAGADLALAAHSAACPGRVVAAAEYAVDVGGPPGTGMAFTAVSPAPGTAVATDESVTVPAATIGALTAGSHTILVESADDLGAWGAAMSTTFVVDRAGPVLSSPAASPAVATPSATVHLTATAVDPVNGTAPGSNVSAAEWFDGVDPGPGLGYPVPAADGTFNSTNEPLTASIPLSGWAGGLHSVSIRARDAAGNWGSPAVVPIVVDGTGPTVSAASATPPQVTVGQTVSLTAAVSDAANGTAAGSAIAAAEWFEGADPGVGAGHAMAAGDGAFNSISEQVTASVPTTSWATGTHTVSIRARDVVGNWGPAATATLTVTALVDRIFADGFESGTPAAWSTVVGGSRLTVSSAARLVGTYGLAATLGGTSYVQDNSPTAEPSYHARFYFSPDGAQPGTSGHTILRGLTPTNATAFSVLFRRTAAGAYQVSAQATSGSSTRSTAWTTITNASHRIEVAFTAGTNGAFAMTVDGGAAGSIGGLVNGTQRIETVQLGPSTGVAGSSKGAEYFDDFVSTHATVIGP